MTLLISWAGVDTHGPSSVYVASDSRISWPNGAIFDQGRKLFACARHPDILGYSGDVLFPALALSQIVSLADSGLLFEPDQSCEDKFQAIVTKLNHLQSAYPVQVAGMATSSLEIIHASRAKRGKKEEFSCQSISWSNTTGWNGKKKMLPSQSDILFALGSGRREFLENYERYRTGPNRDTSRNVFHCFCDTLQNTRDSRIGGAPQLVGLIRKPGSSGIAFGTTYRDSRHYLGATVDNLRLRASNVEWRNENFEIVDGKSMKRHDDAQVQPDPLRRL